MSSVNKYKLKFEKKRKKTKIPAAAAVRQRNEIIGKTHHPHTAVLELKTLSQTVTRHASCQKHPSPY